MGDIADDIINDGLDRMFDRSRELTDRRIINKYKNKPVMTITGKIEKIMETNQVSDSFKKRELVVKTFDNPEYPQEILIEFHQDNTSKLDGYKVGQPVDVSINLRGKSWKSPQDGKVRWFNTLQGWKVELATAEEQPTADQMGDDTESNLPY